MLVANEAELNPDCVDGAGGGFSFPPGHGRTQWDLLKGCPIRILPTQWLYLCSRCFVDQETATNPIGSIHMPFAIIALHLFRFMPTSVTVEDDGKGCLVYMEHRKLSLAKHPSNGTPRREPPSQDWHSAGGTLPLAAGWG